MKIYLGDLRGFVHEEPIDAEKLITMPVHEFDDLPISDKVVHNLALRSYSRALKDGYKSKRTIVQRLMSQCCQINGEIEYRGLENIPDDGCIIMPNHSNSHDAFTLSRALNKAKRPSAYLAAVEGLSPIEKWLFKRVHSTMIDRTNKSSCLFGPIDFDGKVAHGETGVIFGEATWNLTPYDPMLPLKIGPVQHAAISGGLIVPTIMEYLEVPIVVRKESDLYTGCIVSFGEPIEISLAMKWSTQIEKIQQVMEQNRKAIWEEKGIDKRKVPHDVYINHTYLKKFGSPLFEFDSESELKLVRGKDEQPPVNEYTWNDDHTALVPGITQKGYYELKKSFFTGVRIVGKSDKSRVA